MRHVMGLKNEATIFSSRNYVRIEHVMGAKFGHLVFPLEGTLRQDMERSSDIWPSRQNEIAARQDMEILDLRNLVFLS
jgi:hypothetical protein